MRAKQMEHKRALRKCRHATPTHVSECGHGADHTRGGRGRARREGSPRRCFRRRDRCLRFRVVVARARSGSGGSSVSVSSGSSAWGQRVGAWQNAIHVMGCGRWCQRATGGFRDYAHVPCAKNKGRESWREACGASSHPSLGTGIASTARRNTELLTVRQQ